MGLKLLKERLKMAQSRMKASSILVLTVLLIASFLPVLPMATGQNDPSDNHTVNHQTKWWNVTDARTYTANTVIIMEGNNVTVKNGGTLTLDHSKLIFTNPVNSKYGLLVEKGGTLIMKNKSTLTSNGSKPFFCNFSAGSNILIQSSIVSNVSAPWAYWGWNVGIFSASTNLTIDHSLLENNSWMNSLLTVNGSGSVLIKNSTLSSISIYPTLDVFYNSSATLYDDKLVGSGYGEGVYTYDSDLVVQNTEVAGVDYGIDIDHTTAYLKHNKIHNCSEDGFFMYHSSAELVKNEFNNDYNGIHTYGKSEIDMHDGNNFHHNTKEDVRFEAGATLKSKGNTYRGMLNQQLIWADTSTMTFEKDQFYPNAGLSIYANTGSTVTLKDSTLTNAGGNSGGVNGMASSFEVVHSTFIDINSVVSVAYNSHVKMKDSTITTFDFGINAMDGSTFESENNSFTNGFYTFMLQRMSTGTSMNDKLNSNMNFMTAAIQVSEDSKLNVQGFKGTISSVNGTFVRCYTDSSVYITDSPFYIPSAKMFMELSENSLVRSINSSTKIMDKIHYFDETAMVNIGWHVDVETQWQNSAPAPGALVNYKDSKGQLSDSFTTDENGAHSLDMIQYTLTRAGTTNHNSYDFTANLGGMSGGGSTSITANNLEPNPFVITLTDAAKPTVGITYPANNWRTKDGKFVMNGTASDIGSGIAVVKLNNGTGWKDATGTTDWEYTWNLTEGTYKLEVQVTDVSGLINSTSINVTVDMTPPTLTVTTPTALYITKNKFLVNGTTDGVNVTIDGVGATITAGNFSLEVNLTDGAHDIVVVAKDDVGNKVTVTNHVIVDTVSPTLTSNVATGTIVKVAALHLTGTSNGDSVTVNAKAATMDKTNGTWAVDLTLAEGQNVLAIKAMDLAGHTTTLSITVVLDTIPPVILVTAPAGTGPMSTNKADLTITGKVTNATTLMFGGTAVVLGTNGTFTKAVTLVEGKNDLTLTAKDLAGNEVKWQYTVTLDTKAPVVLITSPANGLLTKVGSVVVKGTVDDTAATLKYGTTAVVNSNGTFTLTATLTAGANTIRVNATDAAGNWAIATITVNYDNVPTLTVTAPTKATMSTTKETVRITGTSEAGAKIYINDVAIPTNTDGSFSYDYVLKMGKNTITVKSVDPAGNDKISTFTATRTDATQYDMMSLLGLGIVLLIVGLVIGLIVGMMMGKPKAAAAPKDEDEDEELEKEPEEGKAEEE
jgi:hypothetical protein